MRIFFTQKNKRNIAGFTLVETLVAISIFSMSLLGLMAILSDGIADTGYAKEKVTATYLAQEGIEYIRNMRDTFVLYNSVSGQAGWDNFKNKLMGGTASCQAANGCYFNADSLPASMTQLIITACDVSCPTLLFDSSKGTFGYTSGVPSAFVRKLQATQINANEIRISSSVSWKQGSGNYNLIFSEDVFNWVQ